MLDSFKTPQIPGVESVNFGIYGAEIFQTLDAVGAVDILSMMSREWAQLSIQEPEELAKCPIINFIWIARDSLEPWDLNGGVKIVPNATFDTCPKLDYLLIPGTWPTYKPTGKDAEFLKAKVEEARIVFTVCTGALTLSHVGVLDGRKVLSNKVTIAMILSPENPWPGVTIRKEVLWQKEGRWMVDGKFWTCGGAGSGIDMMGDFIRKTYPKVLVERSFASSEHDVITDPTHDPFISTLCHVEF